MSTLKVNNIQSFTTADPVIINDFLEVKGNISASGSLFTFLEVKGNISTSGSLFTTASTDRLLVRAENLPRKNPAGGGLPEGALFTVSGSQLPFSGSSAELDAVSSSLFVMIQRP